MDALTYKSIMVVGARGVGKTNMMAASLNGKFTERYVPSTRAEYFYDSERGLLLVDTPGIFPPIYNKKDYEAFENDPIVRELVNTVKKSEKVLFKGFDVSTAAAYVLVYCNQTSFLVARALREVIRRHPDIGNIRVYMVNNWSDKPKEWQQLNEDDMSSPLFDGLDPIPRDEFTIFPDKPVCVKTFAGLSNLWDQVASGVDQDLTTNRRGLGTKIDPRSCRTCSIQ